MQDLIERFENGGRIPKDKFLYFYKDYVWKNKEITELISYNGDFFKVRFMKVPTIYSVEDE